MWSRKDIKSRAKNVLRFNYWKSFVVSLIMMVVGLNIDKQSVVSLQQASQDYGGYLGRFGENITLILGDIVAFFLMIWFLIVILRVIIGYAVEVGGIRYFIKSAEGKIDMENILYCFKDGRYINVTLTMLLRSIYLILWTLLLIIPGIIKTYAYKMVPYILADNPNIGHKRAIQLSNEMTKGEKFNIFVLELSFLGWYILGIMALLVGVLFVQPYENATNAELYLILRERAISSGLTSNEELNIERY